MDVLSDELRELGSTSRRLLERSARTSPLPPAFGTPAGLDRVLAFADPAEPRTAVLLNPSRDGVRVRAVAALDVVEPVAAVDVQPVAAPLVPIGAVPAALIRVALAAELVGTAQRALDGAV